MAARIAQATQTWLSSSWHVQVPTTWLHACLEWILEEGGDVAIPQAQMNQQVLDQWLMTDLRDLAHPTLPPGLSEAQRTELHGCYCVQIDSLVDVSQPAYTLLQQCRGTDCTNDQVSAVTQPTQSPWEAKPTRMLMLQLTDGVQSLEGMEYQTIPALDPSLRPGTKLQLSGRILSRLGVLLLKPENVKVLGGEVEELVERNTRRRVLSRLLRLPEEDPQREGEPDDEELLASLESTVEPQRMVRGEGSLDSGYESNSLALHGSARSLASQNYHPELSRIISPPQVPSVPRNSIPVMDDIPYEDFDDFPLEELDSIMFDKEPEMRLEHSSSVDVRPTEYTSQNSTQGNARHQTAVGKVAPQSAPNMPNVESDAASAAVVLVSHAEGPSSQSSRSAPTGTHSKDAQGSPLTRGGRGQESSYQEQERTSCVDTQKCTYLCVQQEGDWPPSCVREVRLHAFIVTLLGNLKSSGGEWRIGGTISDGTGYLDVTLSDGLITRLIGFSASESRAMRLDPVLSGQLKAGMARCQRALVDMCGVMTVRFDPARGGAVVLRVDEISDGYCSDLQRRIGSRREANTTSTPD